MAFSSVAEARRAYETGKAELQASVKVRIRETLFDDEGNLVERSSVWTRRLAGRFCRRYCPGACRSI